MNPETGILSDQQLHILAKRMHFPIAGCFWKDELQSTDLKQNTNYIINLESEFDDDGNPNSGSHWTCLCISKRSGSVFPMYFDSFGQRPPQHLVDIVQKRFKKKINFCEKNIQSMVTGVCGYYVASFLHFITAFPQRTGDILTDSSLFLELFNDLNEVSDYRKNEWMLRLFFQSGDGKLRGLEKTLMNDDERFDFSNITQGKDEKIDVDVVDVPIRE